MPTLNEKINSILRGKQKLNEDAGADGVAKGNGHDQAADRGVGQDSVADAQRAEQKRGQKEGFKPEDDKPGTKAAKASMGTEVDGQNPDNARNDVRSQHEDVKVDVSADVAALVEGENLSEAFKAKATTIFETAVITKVKEELVKIEERYDAQVEEEVNELMTGVIEKVDGYLNYVVEQWIKNNEIALESGIKNEIAETFIQGLKDLFESSYVEVPEDKMDLVGELDSKVTELSGKLDETLEANVTLTKELNDLRKEQVIGKFTEGLTATEQDKFKALANEIAFESADAYTGKLQTIKESYFKKETKKQTTLTETIESGDPSTVVDQKDSSTPMSSYVSALKKKN